MTDKPTYEQMEQRLRELEREALEIKETKRDLLRITKAIEDSSEAIGMSDANGNHFYQNRVFTRLFEYTAEELVAAGGAPAAYVDADIAAEVFSTIMRGMSWAGEVDMLSKSGRRFQVFLRADAIKDDEGKIVGLIGFHSDITARKKAEEAMALKDIYFKQLFESSLDAIVMVDESDTIIAANGAFQSLFQYGPEETRGKRLDDLVVPTENLEEASAFSRRAFKGKPVRKEAARRRKDDSLVQVEMLGFPTLIDNRLVGAYVIYRDISERKKAEDALRESEARYRTLIENAGASIGYYDTGGRVLISNSNMARDLGFKKGEDLIGKSILDLFPEQQAKLILNRINRAAVEKKGDNFEFLTELPHGKKWFITNIQPMKNSEGVISGVLSISTDITDRKTAEEELKKAKDELEQRVEKRTAQLTKANLDLKAEITERRQAEEHIRILTQRLIEAQEDERQKISRELHDRVAQDLSSSKIACDLLLHKDMEEEVKQRIKEISNTLNTTIFAVRDMAYDLRPPGLEELGLIQTILLHCEDFSEKSGVEVDFRYAGIDNLRLSLEAQINIFRLIQEGLNNIRRHAEASRATIRLMGSFPNIILRMEDDGKGFDVDKRLAEAADEKRMGLQSMIERVSLLQGKMTIQSRPTEHTIISVKFPYEANKGDQ
jgi:PAS domain S-box-containing protein